MQTAKISESQDDEIKQALRYAMLLVGIRAQNFPQDEERAVLLSFIRRTYPGHTPAEINLAFDMAVAGELPLKPDDVKCYENFSCEYLGRIMRAYRIWASDQFASIPATSTVPAQLERPKPTNEEILDSFYSAFLKGHLTVSYLPEFVYDRLASTVSLNFSEEQLQSFVLRARETVLTNYLDELKSTDPDRKLGQYLEIKGKLEALKSMEPLDSCNDSNVNRQAKRFAVIHHFTQVKESGATSLNLKP